MKFVILTGQATGQFCPTMASRGEIVKKVVQESGISISAIAKKINISRAQLYLDFSNPQMSFDRILAIGKVLKHDFSQEFKDLAPALISLVNEEPDTYMRELQDCRGQLVEVQAQLIKTMQSLAYYREKYGPEPV